MAALVPKWLLPSWLAAAALGGWLVYAGIHTTAPLQAPAAAPTTSSPTQGPSSGAAASAGLPSAPRLAGIVSLDGQPRLALLALPDAAPRLAAVGDVIPGVGAVTAIEPAALVAREGGSERRLVLAGAVVALQSATPAAAAPALPPPGFGAIPISPQPDPNVGSGNAAFRAMLEEKARAMRR